jgi:glycosyltransferase involved in cell wall biosynthesis
MTRPVGVTIAISNWNHELLLPRALASALRAVALLRTEGMCGEVLVIDDHSRDGSRSLLRKLEALHFADGLRVLALAAHSGFAFSRNQALLNARFPYVLFLNADNELIPENVSCFVRTLQQTRAAAAYGNVLIRSVSSRCAHYVSSSESMQAKLFQANYVDGFALFDRQQLLDDGGYGVDENSAEEQELWMHLAVNGRRCVFVPVALGYHYLLPHTADRGEDHTEKSRLNRVFDPFHLRATQPMNTRHLRYHPEVGYL